MNAYLDPIFQGIIAGLILSAISFGPSFFMLVETSIKYGRKQALSLDFGIISSDALCMFLAYIGTSSFLSGLASNSYFEIVGGGVFLLFGFIKFNKKSNKRKSVSKIKSKTHFSSFISGFIINIANPGVIIYWMSIVAIGIAEYGDDMDGLYSNIFYNVSILIVLLVIDNIKIYFANKLKHVLTPKVLYKIDYVTSLIFIVAGVLIAGRGLMLLI